ncbi:MAG: hypothetical protein KatS3mg011_2441 [Acidimicrobiia bacterium]|nr:MAG: hypothetical protein KatS3mg011_2441 [Acidimicrobiia bacterium]
MGKIDLKAPTRIRFEDREVDGAMFRTDKTEVARFSLSAGSSLPEHSHPEEQIIFVEKGSIRVELEGQPPYEVPAGKASFHPSGVVHQVTAVEDSTLVSLKELSG